MGVRWRRNPGGAYVVDGTRLRAEIIQDGELFVSRVYIDGEERDRGEWASREIAMQNAENAMRRGRFLRRFDATLPSMPGLKDKEDDDES